MNNPKLLILDEPTAGVDKENVEGFYKTVNELNKEGITIMLITHNINESMANYSPESIKEYVRDRWMIHKEKLEQYLDDTKSIYFDISIQIIIYSVLRRNEVARAVKEVFSYDL